MLSDLVKLFSHENKLFFTKKAGYISDTQPFKFVTLKGF